MAGQPDPVAPRASASRGRDLLCALGLALLPFVLFWRVSLGQRVFADGDLFTFNYPILHVVAEQWREGRVPLWNPYIFGGTPLLAAIQGGVFYPPNVLLLLKPLWLWYGYSILLQYSLCGVFGFLYLRRLDLSRAAAVTGSLVYALGAFTMGHLGHVGMLRTVPWLPLVLWGFEAWRREGSGRHLAVGALGVGSMLVAGHPQVPFYALAVAGTYALWFAAVGAPGERRRALVGLVLMLAAGAAVAGVQLLPTAAALRDDFVRDGGGTYEYFTMFSFPPAHLVSLLFPRLARMHLVEMSGYVGIAPLALAVVGGLAARGPHDRHRRYYVGLAVVSVLLVLGRYNPIYPLLHRLPLYNSFRIPSRNWFEFMLAAAVLAALGLDSLRNGMERARRALPWVLAGIALAAVAAATAAAVARGGLGGPAISTRLPFLAATFLLLGGVAARPRAARHPAVAVALPVLVAADLFSFGASLYRRFDPGVYTRAPEVLPFLRRQEGPFRVLTLGAHGLVDPFREALAPDSNATVGVESLAGYDVLVLRHIGPASAGVSGPSGVVLRGPLLRFRRFRWFMDLLNTRFLVVPKTERSWVPDPERYRRVHENDSVVVYENRQALPRFFWVPQVRQADRWSALAALKSGRVGDDPFDPRRSALVEVPPGVPAPDPRLAAPGDPGAYAEARVEILDLRPGDARVRLESRADGLLVHASNMASGWTATVDGARVPVYRTDGFLQGVVVPAGSHEVRFRYDPVSFRAGAAVSLVGLVLVGAVLAWPSLLRRAG